MASSSTSTDPTIVEPVASLSLQQEAPEGTLATTSGSPSAHVVSVHARLMNGDEVVLNGIDVRTVTVDELKLLIHESNKESFPHPQHLCLFIEREELRDGQLTLATFLTTTSYQSTSTSEMIHEEGKPLEETVSSLPQVIHLWLVVSVLHEIISVILSRWGCDQLIEWIQEKQGKRVTGTTLLMRGSEVSSTIIF